MSSQYLRKYYTLTHCWLNVGPASQTMGQPLTSSESTYCVSCSMATNAGSMMGQPRRPWPSIKPASARTQSLISAIHYSCFFILNVNADVMINYQIVDYS